MAERGDGYLYQRGQTWWLGYYHNGVYLRESLHTTDEQQARKRRKEKMKLTNTPHFTPPDERRIMFEDLVGLIRHDYAVVKRNKSTKRLEQVITHLRGIFGLDRAVAITATRIDAYVASRQAESASDATINRELAAMRRMFRLAVKKRRLSRANVPEVTLLAEKNVREGFTEPADFFALCEGLRSQGEPDVADAMEWAYLTLHRRGNVLGTQWAWLRLQIEKGEVTGGSVRMPGSVTKNGRPLDRPLQGRLLDVIRRRWRVRVETCPYVFHRAGRRIVRFDAAWRTACEAIGQAGLSVHDLRRSGARNLRRAGVSETVIMALGGWKTRNVFDRYNVTDEDDLLQAGHAYDAYLDHRATGERKVVTLRQRA